MSGVKRSDSDHDPTQPSSDAERSFLRENVENLTDGEIGQRLGRSAHSVRRKRADVGLMKRTVGPWTETEEAFLREHSSELTDEEIGRHLGRSGRSVQGKRLRLGLTKDDCRWTEAEDRILIEMLDRGHGKKNLGEEISRVLGRSLPAISDRCKRLGRSVRESKGRRTISNYGYRISGHRDGRRVLEHREVVSSSLGRPLRSDEIVHHINGDKTDNRLENLVLCEGPEEHKRVHWSHWDVVRRLMERGVMSFDRGRGQYRVEWDRVRDPP